MKHKGRRENIIGWICITAGILVLMSMILPPGFWWFMLGVALIAGGLAIRRFSCR